MKAITKEARPIIWFSSSVILKAIALDDQVLSVISIVLILVSASLMGRNILKMSDPHYRRHCALGELLFCIVMWLFVEFLTPLIGNLLVSLLCALSAYIYITLFCPKVLRRVLTIV